MIEKVLRILIRVILAAIGVVILFCLTVVAARAVFPAKVKVNCSTDSDGRLVINVRKSFRVPGMMVFLRLSDQPYESLWGVDLGSRKACSVTYGQVPDGARQLWPEPGKPIEGIPPGSVFRIEVYYTDHSASHGGGAKYFTYRMSEDGVPLSAPDQAWWPEAWAWPTDDDPEPSPPSQ